MLTAPRRWIITADARRATLFSCGLAPGARPHVEERGTIENKHESEHEHRRPDLLGGAERRGSVARSGADAAPHSVSQGHGPEEEQRRFAREVAAWLGRFEEARPDDVVVFAAPRFLGLLRDEVRAQRLTPDLREAELTHLRPGQLGAHPAVRALLGIAEV